MEKVVAEQDFLVFLHFCYLSDTGNLASEAKSTNHMKS